MIIQSYKRYVPEFLRRTIYMVFLKDFLLFIEILRIRMAYLLSFLSINSEKKDAYKFMVKHGLTPYPWCFSSEYASREVNCVYDEISKMYYVIHNAKKLYFPITYSLEKVIAIYKSLLVEQDIRSPHRYVEKYTTLRGKNLFDIGSAEGIFTLDAIDYIKHGYLFECDDFWVEALKMTFSPWENKITIIPKYITDKDSENETSLDMFVQKEHITNLFLKMDIEGAELSALKGAETLLKNQNDVQMSICTYHTTKDANAISQYLHSLGYQYSFTEGYLYFQRHLNKAVIRAAKN